MGSALHRNITEKGKPFLEKYGIPYDLSNYQNDGYLRAGDKGYNFWYDHDNGDFETDAPSYKGKGFADLKELLAYALDVADAKEEYRKAWGDDVFKKRSASNFDEDDKPDYEVVNDFAIDAIKDNFTPPKADEEDVKVEEVDTSAIDEKDSGKSEEDDLDLYMKDLDDYMSKNKKGRDDIPVTTRR